MSFVNAAVIEGYAQLVIPTIASLLILSWPPSFEMPSINGCPKSFKLTRPHMWLLRLRKRGEANGGLPRIGRLRAGRGQC
jgi:hypothetical protein